MCDIIQKIRDGIGDALLYILAILFFTIVYFLGLTVWLFGGILGLMVSIIYKK